MEMLSNIVYVVILLLLVIILVCMYFFFNDIRKNKNKINICESDLQALRERMTNMQQKIISLETNMNDVSGIKKSSKNNLADDPSLMPNGSNFAEMLEKLGSLNGNFYDNNMFNVEDENEDEDDEDEEDEDEDEDDEDEDEEEEDEEEEDEEEEEEEVDDKEEVEDEDEDVEDVEEKDIKEYNKKVEEEVLEEEVLEEEENIEVKNSKPVLENIKKVSLSISETSPAKIEKEEKINEKKLPSKPIAKLEIGAVEMGTDNKTQYSVQLNKVGRKYWKRV